MVVGVERESALFLAGAGDSLLGRNHDEVWGTGTEDDSAMFEADLKVAPESAA